MSAVIRTARGALLASALGLALGGCSGLPGSGGDGHEAAARFLEDLRAGRVALAWQGTTPEFKSLRGLENLGHHVKTHPALREKPEFVSSRAEPRGGHGLIEHVFRANTQVRGKPVSTTIRVLVAPHQGDWGVEGLSLD